MGKTLIILVQDVKSETKSWFFCGSSPGERGIFLRFCKVLSKPLGDDRFRGAAPFGGDAALSFWKCSS